MEQEEIQETGDYWYWEGEDGWGQAQSWGWGTRTAGPSQDCPRTVPRVSFLLQDISLLLLQLEEPPAPQGPIEGEWRALSPRRSPRPPLRIPAGELSPPGGDELVSPGAAVHTQLFLFTELLGKNMFRASLVAQ